jgi:hypothetical protein
MASYHECNVEEKLRALLRVSWSQRLLEEISHEKVSIKITWGKKFAERVIETVRTIVFKSIEDILAIILAMENMI